MASDSNPFQVLYVTDSPDPRVFVELFSDFPVRHATALFRPGNVVLRGTQGAGKSMLLNLFKPEIRLAYFRANAEFPVPTPDKLFITGGINLTRSGALDIGQRPLERAGENPDELYPLYFADFLNYYIVRDVIRSAQLMSEHPDAFGSLVRPEHFDAFAQTISQEECWFGYLVGCDTLAQLIATIDERLASYRSFHQYNAELPLSIQTTKTSIGEPIARTEASLKLSGVIENSVPLFVRIDQVERLYRSDVLRPQLGQQYRRIVNKALGLREPRVSYRVGIRTYAWDDDLQIFGSEDRLEHIRDFRFVTLDDLLRRPEDRKTWIFPKFAEDTFQRRLRYAGLNAENTSDLVGRVFGSQIDFPDVARQYSRTSPFERVTLVNDDWSPEWNSRLEEIFAIDPLEAVLAAAWARQGSKRQPRLRSAPPTDAPWLKTYWKKERVRQGLVQVAARTAQRLKWSGKESILALSGGNISIFLSVCHEIWDALLRADRRHPQGGLESEDFPINPDVQAVGIYTASRFWYDKIAEQPKGDDRQRFVDVLGSQFRKWLLADEAMSYPGHNGFSMAAEDLDRNLLLQRFLNDATDFGDLTDAPHTTKERDRKKRRKWYLSPILSPLFQIPEVHVKEPYYAQLSDLVRWVHDARVMIPGLPPAHPARSIDQKPRREGKPSDQRTLQFDDDDVEQEGL